MAQFQPITASCAPTNTAPCTPRRSSERPSILDRWPHKSKSISDITAAAASPPHRQKSKSNNNNNKAEEGFFTTLGEQREEETKKKQVISSSSAFGPPIKKPPASPSAATAASDQGAVDVERRGRQAFRRSASSNLRGGSSNNSNSHINRNLPSSSSKNSGNRDGTYYHDDDNDKNNNRNTMQRSQQAPAAITKSLQDNINVVQLEEPGNVDEGSKNSSSSPTTTASATQSSSSSGPARRSRSVTSRWPPAAHTETANNYNSNTNSDNTTHEEEQQQQHKKRQSSSRRITETAGASPSESQLRKSQLRKPCRSPIHAPWPPSPNTHTATVAVRPGQLPSPRNDENDAISPANTRPSSLSRHRSFANRAYPPLTTTTTTTPTSPGCTDREPLDKIPTADNRSSTPQPDSAMDSEPAAKLLTPGKLRGSVRGRWDPRDASLSSSSSSLLLSSSSSPSPPSSKSTKVPVRILRRSVSPGLPGSRRSAAAVHVHVVEKPEGTLLSEKVQEKIAALKKEQQRSPQPSEYRPNNPHPRASSLGPSSRTMERKPLLLSSCPTDSGGEGNETTRNNAIGVFNSPPLTTMVRKGSVKDLWAAAIMTSKTCSQDNDRDPHGTNSPNTKAVTKGAMMVNQGSEGPGYLRDKENTTTVNNTKKPPVYLRRLSSERRAEAASTSNSIGQQDPAAVSHLSTICDNNSNNNNNNNNNDDDDGTKSSSLSTHQRLKEYEEMNSRNQPSGQESAASLAPTSLKTWKKPPLAETATNSGDSNSGKQESHQPCLLSSNGGCSGGSTKGSLKARWPVATKALSQKSFGKPPVCDTPRDDHMLSSVSRLDNSDHQSENVAPSQHLLKIPNSAPEISSEDSARAGVSQNGSPLQDRFHEMDGEANIETGYCTQNQMSTHGSAVGDSITTLGKPTVDSSSSLAKSRISPFQKENCEAVSKSTNITKRWSNHATTTEKAPTPSPQFSLPKPKKLDSKSGLYPSPSSRDSSPAYLLQSHAQKVQEITSSAAPSTASTDSQDLPSVQPSSSLQAQCGCRPLPLPLFNESNDNNMPPPSLPELQPTPRYSEVKIASAPASQCSPVPGISAPPSLAERRETEGKHLLVLMSSQSLSREQLAIQQKVQVLLKVTKIPYRELDGSVKTNLNRRNELFDLSGIKGKYPQFFVVDNSRGDGGHASFFGDWETVDLLNENGTLLDSYVAATAALSSVAESGQGSASVQAPHGLAPPSTSPGVVKTAKRFNPVNQAPQHAQLSTDVARSGEHVTSKNDEKYLLVLISSQSLSREQLAIQQKVQTILKILQIPYQNFDGSIKDNCDRRNELFKLSGIWAKYPQFFVVHNCGQTSFWGDWDMVDLLNENGTLLQSFLAAQSSSPTEPIPVDSASPLSAAPPFHAESTNYLSRQQLGQSSPRSNSCRSLPTKAPPPVLEETRSSMSMRKTPRQPILPPSQRNPISPQQRLKPTPKGKSKLEHETPPPPINLPQLRPTPSLKGKFCVEEPQTCEKQMAEEKYVLVLMSSQTLTRDQLAIQQKVQTIMSSLKIPYQEFDGALQANRDRRNELFTLSGIRAKYPQFFLMHKSIDMAFDSSHTASFWGDWETVDLLHENGKLLESFHSAHAM